MHAIASGTMDAYLDNAATTPMRAEALDAMLPFMRHRFGNPSGSHTLARDASRALDEARELVSSLVGCDPGELVFTSGGTEADNIAVLGVHRARGGRVICSAVEHHAVLDTCIGIGGETVAVDSRGVVDLDSLAQMLDPDVTLVSVMLANNETGVVQPIDEVVQMVRELAPAAVIHSDMVHGAPWIDLTGPTSSVDLISLSAHKFGGPKGVGAIVVRSGVQMSPLMHGGGQERQRRPGTQNVAGIVGMAAALKATVEHLDENALRVEALRNRLASGLVGAVGGTVEVATAARRVPGTLSLSFEGVDAQELLVLLDDAGICASAGSACASGATEPSHVLSAMGMSRGEARSTVRFSLGYATTSVEVDHVLSVVPQAVERLRS